MTSDIKDLGGTLAVIGAEVQALALNIVSAGGRNILPGKKDDEEKEKESVTLVGSSPVSVALSNQQFTEEHEASLEKDVPSLISLVAEYKSVAKAIKVQDEMKDNLLRTK